MSTGDVDRWSNPCKFGWTEYDGSRWCGEHDGAVWAGEPPGTACTVLRRHRAGNLNRSDVRGLS